MTTPPQPKTGIVLLNMGGPESLETVGPFLYNLFSDPDIIRLPFSSLLQKPLAWTIVNSRLKEAQHNYRQMGGNSPQLDYTLQQRDALRLALQNKNIDLPMAIAMRYWHPFTEAAVDELLAQGVTNLIALPLYPHFSYTTTGSSVKELQRVLNQKAPGTTLKTVEPYYHHPLYLQALSQTIAEALANNEWACPQEEVQILFSAHSLPKKHVARTKDPYPDQIFECVTALMKTHFPQHKWELSFQSRVGNMPWLGPYTDGVLHYFAGKHIDNVLVVPISFVSEHVETLVEIDQLYGQLANDLGIKHYHRASTLNTNPLFIECLANLVTEAMNSKTTEPEEAAIS